MKNLMAVLGLRDIWGFVRFLARRFKEDRCTQIASSLTFTTLLALVPLVTIALTSFSAFPVFTEFSEQIKQFVLSNMLPETGGRLISSYVQQFAASATKLTTVGVAFLAVTAMLMMRTIDIAFNTIWRVSQPRPLLQRIIVYWAVLTLAPLLVGGSLTLTSWLISMSAGYAHQIPALGMTFLKLVPVLLTTLAFSLLFRIVPNRYVPVRHALLGGVVAAVAFESMNRAFAFYIAHFPTYTLVYGAFASIPIFLLWIYLSWLTILCGALIAASISHWRSHFAKQLMPATELYYALCVLKMMNEGLASATVQSLPTLSKQLHIGFDTLEQILEKLARANVVRKLVGNGWAMIRNAEHVQMSELYRLFIFDTSVLAAHSEDTKINAWLKKMEQPTEEMMKATVRDVLDETKRPDESKRIET